MSVQHGDKAARTKSERFNVPGAEILDHDVWSEDGETCPSCGSDIANATSRCPECGQWLERCSRSCPSCASPRCVGGGRNRAE